jgi:hypothetical protein
MLLMSFFPGESARRTGRRDDGVHPRDSRGPGGPGDARSAGLAGNEGHDSPPANRAAVGRLRDPRLWTGVLIVAVCALVGGHVLAAADDTVELWAAAHDLSAGSPLAPEDLVATSVRFDDPDSLRAYLPAAAAVSGRELAQPVQAGQLISSSAVGAAPAPLSELPLGVAGSDLPADLAVGDRVDVWAVPDEVQSGGAKRVIRVAAGVRVVSVDTPELVGASGDRHVVVGVDSDAAVEAALRGLAGMRAVLVRIGG